MGTQRHYRLVLLGPPGAGKGTQAREICAELDIPHISTGDILRKHKAAQSPLGLEASEFMARGELVPDELVMQMVVERLGEPDASNGFLLDGFPRSLKQAEALAGLENASLTAVIELGIADQPLVDRLMHRRCCPKCGHIYHLKASPPRNRDLCDYDGCELVWRADDKESVIRKRLQVYHQQTEPVSTYYRRKRLLVTFDANVPPETLSRRILEYLRSETNVRV